MNFLVHIIFTLAQAAQAWKVQGSQACCVLLPLETHQILWSSFVINIHKHPEVCMLSSHLSCPIVHFVPWHQSRLLMKTNACCYVVCKKKTWVCVKTGYPYFPLFPMVFMCHDFFLVYCTPFSDTPTCHHLTTCQASEIDSVQSWSSSQQLPRFAHSMPKALAKTEHCVVMLSCVGVDICHWTILDM